MKLKMKIDLVFLGFAFWEPIQFEKLKLFVLCFKC